MNYGSGWKRVRKEVRERDKVCRDCGKTPEQNGSALDVHHVGPFRFTGDNNLDNLKALCRSCHMRTKDHGRRGSALFAGPKQLQLRPLTTRELRKRRGAQQRRKRYALQQQAFALTEAGRSLRQVARELGVSHQTIANWLKQRGVPTNARAS